MAFQMEILKAVMQVFKELDLPSQNRLIKLPAKAVAAKKFALLYETASLLIAVFIYHR